MIKISDHFTFRRLYRFVLPSVVMMVFTSIYGVVDGFFVSNFAGKTAFAAVNLIMPFVMLVSAIGFMVGTGGNALVSKTLGEGDKKKANEIFSLLIYFTIAVAVVLTVVAQLSLKRVCILLGADEQMLPYSVLYGRITLCTVTFFSLQNVFQSLLVTAGRPKIGLFVTVGAGVMNMILDLLFVGVFKWGITGAGTATCIAEIIGGGVPLVYFISRNKSDLRLKTKIPFDLRAILKTCGNGASELMTNISMSLVNMLYNLQLMRFFGQNGVAAYGTIMYVNFVFVSAFIGYNIGSAPIIGYNYGANNHAERKNVYQKSLLTTGFLALILTAFAMILSAPIADFFTGYDEGLFELTKTAFRLFSTCYLVLGFNIFASSYFTALNNGLVSAIISFSRTLLFQVVMIFALPAIFGKDFIWLSVTVSEVVTLLVSVGFLMKENHFARRAKIVNSE